MSNLWKSNHQAVLTISEILKYQVLCFLPDSEKSLYLIKSHKLRKELYHFDRNFPGKIQAWMESCCSLDGFNFYIVFSIKLLPRHCIKSYFDTIGKSFWMRCEISFKAGYGYWRSCGNFQERKMLSDIGQSYFVDIYMCSWLK